MTRSRSLPELHPKAMPVLLAAIATVVPTVEAQDPDRRRAGHPVDPTYVLDRVHTVSPESGPVGTEVRVRVTELPAMTSFRVGFGSQGGYVTEAAAMADEDGELAVRLQVPDWAETDRSYSFVVFDSTFQALAVTRPFHVTDADGGLLRRGRIRETVADCALMEARDGLTYGLDYNMEYDIEEPAMGDYVVVEGRLAEEDRCSEETDLDIDVQRIEVRGPGG